MENLSAISCLMHYGKILRCIISYVDTQRGKTCTEISGVLKKIILGEVPAKAIMITEAG